jgi:signal peptidase II
MILKKLNKSLLNNISLTFLIFLLDRISKIYIINLDKKLSGSEIFSSKFINITLIWNEGIAFGLLSFDQNNLYNLLTLLIIIVIFIIGWMTVKSHGLKKYSLIMILGGAIGNLYDRIFFKAVPDFIDFHIGNFHWFIFNFADVFITLGVFFMILLEIIDNSRNKSEYEKF